MQISFRVSTKTRMLVLAIDPENFQWSPGEIESGKSSPAERFDACADQYWLWGWLGLTVFYACTRAFY